MAYSAFMSRQLGDPRSAHDFSSPQVRVRSAADFRQYSSQRLRLPNERRPLVPRVRQLFGALLTLAILGGIGVGVYFGVTALLERDDTAATEVAQSTGAGQTPTASDAASESEPSGAVQQRVSQPEPAASPASASSVEEPDSSATAPEASQQSQAAPSDSEAAQTSEPPASVSEIEPSVAQQPVTTAQIDGAEIEAARVTAEAIPSGIPRTLADGAAYDPTEPATVFTSRWPIGTTLRLTRLPGATLLTEEEQEQVIGTETLVVVRGSESSNTDLQLSPAAFDQIAIYGTERIIAVRVEVTAAPP